jgi:hypothetical protein
MIFAVPSTGAILKETKFFSGFKNSYQKSAKQENRQKFESEKT